MESWCSSVFRMWEEVLVSGDGYWRSRLEGGREVWVGVCGGCMWRESELELEIGGELGCGIMVF